MALAAGDRLGPYEILAPLGAGGMGEVYRARDTRLNREVAIKISQEQFSERFEREARAVAALNHPHICTLYDVGPNYLVMELIGGVPLRGPLSQQETLRFAGEICDALDHAHQRGIIHRDLKPSNILVTPQGIKLLDFGLARITVGPSVGPDDATQTQMTQAGAVMGTPAYMAPEQWAGKPADARSDIYAVGCVLYEMLIGRRIAGHRRPLQPAAMEKVLQKCLEANPAARYQSAGELKQALDAVSHPSGFRREYIVAAGSVVMLVAGLALLVMQFPSNQRLSDKDVLVLADFSNATGDTIFDGTLRTALAIQLEQSPFLKIMDDEQMQQDLKLMGRAPDTRITNVIAHDICVREGQKAMINGAIADLGKVFVVTVQAVNCQNGATLAREQMQAEGREQVLNAISKAATGIRAKLGESLSSIQKLDRPFGQVTTPSIEAFQAYALGMAQRETDLASAPFFQHAIELDPMFAMAYLQLYFVYNSSGDSGRAIEYLTKAFALADHSSDYERLRIQANYYRAAGDINKAADTNQLLARSYPRANSAHNQLAAIYTELGEFDKALEERLKIDDAVLGSARQILSYTRLDRFDDAASVPRKPDIPPLHRALLQLAYIQRDSVAATKEIEWFMGKPEEYRSLAEQSQNALIHGEFKKAAALAQQGARLAEQHDLQGAANQLLAQVAGMGEFRGSCEGVQQIGAVAALLCSNAEAPLKAAEAQAKERPNDTLLNAVRLPVARATLALQQNQPSQAIEVLRAAAPYERAYSQVPYLRGIAYLRRNEAAAAAAEFQKIVDHKGANWGVVYPLSYLGVGRAWALAGDSAKAKSAYQAFFAMWKDADPDLPVLAQAKKEFAALK